MKIVIYDLVKKILTENPESRDDDKLLVWMVWSYHCYGSVKAYDKIELDYVSFRSMPNVKTITKSRREAQRLHAELRGAERMQKQRKKQQDTKGTFIFREKTTAPARLLEIPAEKPRNSNIW